MSADIELTVVVPKGAESRIERDLVRLSALLAHLGLSEEVHGLFGGEHGYGPEFYENDVFLFKAFCWCDKPDCPWCATCNCPAEAWHYFVDGVEVSWEAYIDFFKREAGEVPVDDPQALREWKKRAQAVNARRSVRHDPICEFCTRGVGLDKGAEPGKRAPNFWHKPSGLKIWWYKWIGRSMEFNRQVERDEWESIFRECLDSVIEAADKR